MPTSPLLRHTAVCAFLAVAVAAFAIAVHADEVNGRDLQSAVEHGFVRSSARDIPVSAKVDIVVVGPKKIAWAQGHEAALGQFKAKGFFGFTFYSGRLANRMRDS